MHVNKVGLLSKTGYLEMEVYNPPEHGYRSSCRKGVLTFLSPLCGVNPIGVAANSQFSRTKINREGLLRPGTYGQMELVLETFKMLRTKSAPFTVM